jgi:integrase
VEDYRRRGGRSAEGIESVVRRNVLPDLGAMAVRKLTTRRLLDWHRDMAARPRYWRSRRGAKPNTASFDPKDAEAVRRRRANANRILTYLKAALNHAWRNGLVPSDDAWRRVKPFKSVDAPIVRYFSNREIRRLLEACEGAFRDMVYAALLTGCRYGELRRLRVADYDPEVSTLVIRQSKSGKTLPRVASEMALHVLAYNLTRVINLIGVQPLMAAMRA